MRFDLDALMKRAADCDDQEFRGLLCACLLAREREIIKRGAARAHLAHDNPKGDGLTTNMCDYLDHCAALRTLITGLGRRG